jgi:hypothetical protein
MVYRDRDPREILIEVLGEIEEAKVRLSRAETKMTESGLSEAHDYREVSAFIVSALQSAQMASEAAIRRSGET